MAGPSEVIGSARVERRQRRLSGFEPEEDSLSLVFQGSNPVPVRATTRYRSLSRCTGMAGFEPAI